MKKSIIALFIASLGLTQAQAKTDLPELSKELEIMTGIMQTALRQNNSRSGIRFRSIDATYLAKQGVVFEISTSNSGVWQFDLGNVLSGISVPTPPEPPVAISGDGGNWVVEVDDEWVELAEQLAHGAQDAMRDARDKLRDLREREREYSWEQREYERRKRDLEFEKRNADEDSRKRIEERKKELESELQKLKSKQAEVSQYAAQIEEEQKKQNAERNAAKQKEYKRFLAGFESSVGDLLCKYGAGIKALPSDENVSFVLNKFGSVDSRAKQDKIYVFKHKDIQDCVRDKIDTNKLLAQSDTYMF